MTGAELKTFAESILDGDSIDSTFFYQLLNVAKNRLEDSRPWMYLRALDSTQTATTGNNYDTALSLPTAWRRTWKLYVGEDLQYFPVPFDQQHLYRYHGRRFVVDVANSTFYLLGNVGSADTIYHYYIKTTDDIESGTSWTAPSRFHALLGFEVAGYIQMGVDADDIFARMSPENKMQAQLVRRSMEDWDTNLQLAEQNDQAQIADSAPAFDLGLL
jgi:hypothetical protein